MITIDFHVHSKYSYDSDSEIDEIIFYAKRRGINVVCIVDHNVLRLKTEIVNDVLIIAGEEINTTEGEVIGLYLKKEIPMGLTPIETVNEIKHQDGLVYLPHPFDFYRKAMNPRAVKEIIEYIDIVEVLNSKSLTPVEGKMATWLAKKYNKKTAAGSDAHRSEDVGNAFVEFDSDILPTTPDKMIALFNSKYRIVGGHRKLIPAVIKKLKSSFSKGE